MYFTPKVFKNDAVFFFSGMTFIKKAAPEPGQL
jgi:hypothetical protein